MPPLGPLIHGVAFIGLGVHLIHQSVRLGRELPLPEKLAGGFETMALLSLGGAGCITLGVATLRGWVAW